MLRDIELCTCIVIADMMILLECLITRLHSNLLGYIIRTVRMSRLLIDFHTQPTAAPTTAQTSNRRTQGPQP